jgi:hypothetical protein
LALPISAASSVIEQKYSVCAPLAALAQRLGPKCCELLMTAQDKRDRAKRLREIAATKSGTLAHDIIQQAQQLEAAADEQERNVRLSQRN